MSEPTEAQLHAWCLQRFIDSGREQYPLVSEAARRFRVKRDAILDLLDYSESMDLLVAIRMGGLGGGVADLRPSEYQIEPIEDDEP